MTLPPIGVFFGLPLLVGLEFLAIVLLSRRIIFPPCVSAKWGIWIKNSKYTLKYTLFFLICSDTLRYEPIQHRHKKTR